MIAALSPADSASEAFLTPSLMQATTRDGLETAGKRRAVNTSTGASSPCSRAAHQPEGAPEEGEGSPKLRSSSPHRSRGEDRAFALLQVVSAESQSAILSQPSGVGTTDAIGTQGPVRCFSRGTPASHAPLQVAVFPQFSDEEAEI